MKKLLLILSAAIFLSSCEKVIDVKLKDETPFLVVDAFINSDTISQQITLTYSRPYFDQNTAEPAVGALVKVVSSEGDTFHFTDNNNSGKYVWAQNNVDTLCKLGISYRLLIDFQGSKYEAGSQVNVAPTIDSMAFEPNIGFDGQPNGLFGQFYANDPANQFDFYWIKSYTNGVNNDGPSTINLSVNGGQFYPGYDGAMFIQPVRYSINNFQKPYEVGDSVRVEIYSITKDTWQYFGEMVDQINNQGLFATPTNNVRTNIIRTAGSGADAQGWFCTSALSRKIDVVK